MHELNELRVAVHDASEKHLIYKTLRVGTIVGFQAILLHAAMG